MRSQTRSARPPCDRVDPKWRIAYEEGVKSISGNAGGAVERYRELPDRALPF
jgi:hypothetical protein